ncbi:MAG TPA: hypothetical protein PLE85_10895 [Bacteroidales bacterium]|nr:hypothetical protein [Lentimicrobiaceae bacterium]HOI01030.1 hypothetical protein [Bacteroidales bacterium]
MKYALFFFPLLLSLGMVACDKDMDEPEPLPLDNFFPTSRGSYWTYAGYDGGLTYNVEITGTDTINGIPYVTFNHSLYGTGKFRKNGGSYYHLFNINGTDTEFLYLKHDQAAGHTWTMEYSMSGIPTRLKYTIEEVDVDKVINGMFYKDVISVRMDTYIDQGGGFDSVYISGIYHYANNIGFIFSDVSGEGMTYLEFFNIK